MPLLWGTSLALNVPECYLFWFEQLARVWGFAGLFLLGIAISGMSHVYILDVNLFSCKNFMQSPVSWNTVKNQKQTVLMLRNPQVCHSSRYWTPEVLALCFLSGVWLSTLLQTVCLLYIHPATDILGRVFPARETTQSTGLNYDLPCSPVLWAVALLSTAIFTT